MRFFKYQAYGPMEIDKTSSSSQQFTITNRYSMPALQLRQPQPQNNETPGIKLGYVLAICVHETWIKFPIKIIWISIYTTTFTPNQYWNRYNWTLQQIATSITAGRSWMIYPWSFHPICHRICSTWRNLLFQSLMHYCHQIHHIWYAMFFKLLYIL